MTDRRILRALISVTDKTGAAEFARGLARHGVELLSTGGTAQHLRAAGAAVTDVAAVTGFPEIMNGRVKTLHPAVHGGILARRDDREHMRQAEEAGIPLIDLVAVNLYAFARAAARPGATRDEAMEDTDIGGPAMIRAAAKNHRFVAAVTDPADYGAVLEEMAERKGALSLATRERLAAKAFALTASYDAAVHAYLAGRSDPGALPRRLQIFTGLGRQLRYGENPHQRAAFYPLGAGGAEEAAAEPSAAGARILNGKELSYNNYLDIDAAFELVKEFAGPAAAVIKHTNPCGAAEAETAAQAVEDALAGDPLSAFGGILALNRPLDAKLAEAVADPGCFFEAVIAPDIEAAAVDMFRKKVKWGKSVRLLAAGAISRIDRDFVLRSVKGGILLQDRDQGFDGEEQSVVTQKAPSSEELDTLAFAWKTVKHVKSNGVLLARKTRGGHGAVGVGAGQMSRIDALRIAGQKAGERARGAVLASDAFFPFRDCVDAAAELGVRAIIQPGGSVRDAESIAAADEHGVPMVFTGRRHFRH